MRQLLLLALSLALVPLYLAVRGSMQAFYPVGPLLILMTTCVAVGYLIRGDPPPGALALYSILGIALTVLAWLGICVAAEVAGFWGAVGFIAALAGWLGVLSFVRYARSRPRRRAEAGLCPQCGYDLRETYERCPECGTEIPEELVRRRRIAAMAAIRAAQRGQRAQPERSPVAAAPSPAGDKGTKSMDSSPPS